MKAKSLNNTAKLAFFQARKREGDVKRLSQKTNLTTRYINYVLRGERGTNETLANEMFNISRRRVKNSELI